MDEKTQRYMQRIDQLISTPTKSAARPGRSPLRPFSHELDKYIKYERSIKAIQEVISRNNLMLVNSFFNAIRSSELRQREKIFKFIAVEKSQSKEMRIDATVSGKLLMATLKDIAKRKYTDFVNSLIEFTKNATTAPQKQNTKAGTIGRKRSSKEAAGFGVLMRTTTIPERDSYRKVSEWIDDSSALEEKINQKNQQSQKYKKIAAKTIGKAVQIKVQGILLFGFCNLQVSSCRKKQKQAQLPQQITLESSLESKIVNRVKSAYLLAEFQRKFVSQILAKIKRHNTGKLARESDVVLICETLHNIYCRQRFRYFHNFFTYISPIKTLIRSQVVARYRQKSQLKNSNYSSRSNQSNNQSQVFPLNTLNKLNFSSFVDRIFKFMLIVSKMLIPLREAFIKIDQYASFSYRVEESLKVAPRRYLLEAFSQIKLAKHSKKSEDSKQSVRRKQGEKLFEFLADCLNQRLVDGFIYIKIAAERRHLKSGEGASERMNIIESTKRFILDREQYTSQSHQNWNQLKSIFLSPNQKFRKLQIQI